jgi:hypothetical protein
MKVATMLAVALVSFGPAPRLGALQSGVVINLTQQTAYLFENGRVALISPIASGKEGVGNPDREIPDHKKGLEPRFRGLRSGGRYLRQNR